MSTTSSTMPSEVAGSSQIPVFKAYLRALGKADDPRCPHGENSCCSVLTPLWWDSDSDGDPRNEQRNVRDDRTPEPDQPPTFSVYQDENTSLYSSQHENHPPGTRYVLTANWGDERFERGGFIHDETGKQVEFSFTPNPETGPIKFVLDLQRIRHDRTNDPW